MPRRIVFLRLLLLAILALSLPVWAEEHVSLDDPESSEDTQAAATETSEEAETTETAGEEIQQEEAEAPSAGEAVDEIAEEVAEGVEHVEAEVTEAQEAAEATTRAVFEEVDDAIDEPKSGGFLQKVNKKKIAALVLGAWGVGVGVGWLGSKGYMPEIKIQIPMLKKEAAQPVKQKK